MQEAIHALRGAIANDHVIGLYRDRHGKIGKIGKDGQHIELREKAVIRSSRLFATTNLRQLDVRSRLILAKELRKEYRCSFKQIARIIHLDLKYIKELV